MLREVVVASPQVTEDQLDTGLLLRELGDEVGQVNVQVKFVLSLNVSPDGEDKIVGLLDELEESSSVVVTSSRVASFVVLVGLDLFWRELGVHIHVLKDEGSDIVKLGALDLTKHSSVVGAPVEHALVRVSKGLTLLVLHGADHVLSDLTHVGSMFEIRVLGLPPLGDEVVQISFAINIGQRVAGDQFWLDITRLSELF